MRTEELKRNISSGADAYNLLNEANPNFKSRFKRINESLSKLLSDIRAHFPEANYFVESGHLLVVLGNTQDKSAFGQIEVNSELTALVGNVEIDGGVWQ